MAVQNIEDTQITCRFVTKLPAELRVPETPVAVPANLTRYGLSQVINGLLQLDPARPFDFLINEELLRLSLGQFLLAHTISAETVLEVEYTTALLPPKVSEQAPHDDWVSAVDGSRRGCVVSGSYDGALRVWRTGGPGQAPRCAATSAALGAPITAVAALPASQGSLALSGGQDNLLRLWRLPALAAPAGKAARASGGGGAESEAEVVAVYRGHADAVESLAVSPAGTSVASGGWDGALRIWRTGAAVAEAAAEAARQPTANGGASAVKKRRAGAGGQALPAQPLEQSEEAALAGHTQCVSAVAWQAPDTLASASWDHSVRRWDVAANACVDTLNVRAAVYCLAAQPGGGGLLAFGGAERALRVWDPRTKDGEALAVRALASHSDWVAACAWCPASGHHLVTASHDASLKLWDLRAPIPLHTLQAHTDKVLCVDWAGATRIVSGGADCALRFWEVELPAKSAHDK